MGKKNKKFGEASFGAAGGFGSGQSMSLPYKNPAEDPLKELPEPTGDLETDSNAETKALHDAMLETRRDVDRQVQYAVDGSFYFVACFKSTAARDLFLKETGLEFGVYRRSFVDGYELARNIGVDVPTDT